MRSFPLVRNFSTGIVTVAALLDSKYQLKLVLDTGATHTTIDSNALFLAGYSPSDTTGQALVETVNGIVQTELFRIKSLKSIGISRAEIAIQSYDFLGHGIVSDYDGLLGLDFLEAHKFCIDLRRAEISIEE